MHLYLVHVLTHWLSCIFLSLPIFHNNYLVPEMRKKHPPSYNKVLSAAVLSLFNQMLAMPYIIEIMPLCMNTGTTDTDFAMFVKFAFYSVVADLWFYWTHRLLHHPYLYKHIHSIHHRWTYPMPIRTLYCHPIEHILANASALIIGPFIWKGGQNTIMLWTVLATFNAVLSHSGIDLGWPIFTAKKHDIHHRILNSNYGTTGISDRLFGTRKF